MIRVSGLRGPLGAAFTVSQGRAVAKTSADLGAFKGLQRAANQWVLKTKQLVLTPVDGQIGILTWQIVRDGILLAQQLGNTLAQEAPVDVNDLATYVEQYAITLASLAGVTVDNSPSCRTTDYRGDLKPCATTTNPPPTSLLGGGLKHDEEEPPGPGIDLPVVSSSPKANTAGFAILGLVILGTVVAVQYGKKKRKKASRFMGMPAQRPRSWDMGCKACSGDITPPPALRGRR